MKTNKKQITFLAEASNVQSQFYSLERMQTDFILR